MLAMWEYFWSTPWPSQPAPPASGFIADTAIQHLRTPVNHLGHLVLVLGILRMIKVK